MRKMALSSTQRSALWVNNNICVIKVMLPWPLFYYHTLAAAILVWADGSMINMAVEIERKFLINPAIWQPKDTGVSIRQGYLSLDPYRTVRVRTKEIQESRIGYLTIKGKTKGISRVELEYEIPFAEASQMLDELCHRPLIEKTRYIEEHNGQVWEIDVFFGDNEGLMVAEAELKDENQLLLLPEWIVQEVSDDERYFNASLIKNPYKNWK